MNKSAPAPKRVARALPGSREDLKERFKDYPGITAWDRAYDSPDGPGSLPILLADEQPDACVDTGHQNALKLGAVKCGLCGRPARKWYLRHVNTKQQGRVSQIRAKGLIPVQFSELRRPDEIADLVGVAADGLVHTGVNGSKMLYKIPLDLYNARKRRERDIRDHRGKSAKQVRADLASDAGSVLGAEAADAIYDGLQYEERTIRTTLQDEANAVGVEDD